ncbi:MAG: hypothetical protein IKM75_09205 [Bacteroidales bacterium]|nr:hypothetical protein [Bacteroidales bacterium]MBR6865025.1 hypothetical protein [Bacteroidales bacterium]
MIIKALLLSFLALSSPPDTSTVVGRIQYVYSLKDAIDATVWPGFAAPKNDVPLVYYEDSLCYVANPTEAFVGDRFFKDGGLEIIRLPRVDDIPFHMHVDCTDSLGPIMRCSSPEVTKQFVPDVPSVDVWAPMVMHEYFHGFQFKQEGFFDEFMRISSFESDTLTTLCADYAWFKESVVEENALLLKAIERPGSAEDYMREFFELRDKRRARVLDELGTDIVAFEQLMEVVEGSARYIEYHLYRHLGTFRPAEFQWLFIPSNKYYYALGFNALRLLDKLGIDYRGDIFDDVEAVEKLLRGI